MADAPEGFVVLVINSRGVAEAFGPYLDEDEAAEVAAFAAHLVPTWMFDLEPCGHERCCLATVHGSKYGDDGVSADLPRRQVPRPTRAAGRVLPRAEGPAPKVAADVAEHPGEPGHR